MPDPDRIFRRYLERPTRRRLARVVRAYHEHLWRVALRVTRNHEDAADLCQEVFLKLLLEPPAPDSVRSPEGWLAWRVVARWSASRWRDARRRLREAAGARRARADGLTAEDVEALREAVAALPEDLRASVELRYLAGLSNREAAETLGLTVRGVEDRLHRAREHLARKLGALLPALALLEAEPLEAEPPPVELLPSLLRRGRLGGALAAASQAAGAGGAAVAKKAVAAAGALLLLGLGTAWVARWAAERAAERPGPVAGGAAPVEEARGPPPPAEEPRPDAAKVAPEPAPARGAVRVAVSDEDASPVPGAVVAWTRVVEPPPGAEAAREETEETEETLGEARADEAGKCVLSDLEPGRHLLRAWTPTQRCALHFSLRLAAGEEKEMSMLLHRLHRLRGTVRDAASLPVPGAKVVVGNHGEEEFRETVHRRTYCGVFPADARGRYDTGFRLMVHRSRASDPLEVWVLAEGHALARETIRRDQFQDREAALDVVLAPEMPVTLRVTDTGGLPIAGARVLGSDDLRSAETGPDGRAALRHLPAEQREVSVSKEGFWESSALVAPGRSEEVPVVLRPHGPAIEGRVTFDEAIPEMDRILGTIELYSAHQGGDVLSLNGSPRRLDPEKLEYRFWPISPHRYAIQRQHKGLVSTSPVVQYTGREPARADIHVRLEPPYLAGVVTRKDTGAPAAGIPVSVRCVRAGAEHRSTWARFDILNGFCFPGVPGNGLGVETGPDGRFLLSLPRGSEPLVAAVRAGSREAGRTEDVAFEIDRETAVDDLRLELLPGGSVEGTIAGEDGEPAPRELVAAWDCLGVLEWAQSGDGGRYRIDGLRPGRYLVLPLGRCPAPTRGGGLGGSDDNQRLPPPHELFERPVEVRCGEAARWDIDLRRDRLGAIRGLAAEPLPAAGKVTRAFLLDGKPVWVWGLRDETGLEDRRFAFENLWPGAYLLSLEDPETRDARLAEARVEVRRGAVTEATLERPRAALVLTVEAAGGAPVEDVRVLEAERWSFAPSWSAREEEWERWGGWTAEVDGSRLRVEALPAGRVRVLVAARGFVPAWSEPVQLREGAESVAPALVLERGREVRVRVETEEGVPLPVSVRFSMRPSAAGEEGPELQFLGERLAGEPVWALSAFAPGEYELVASASGAFGAAKVRATVPADRDLEVTVVLRRR
ncbi:MAG: sigma-70 family RNA polymerase sigma factor [Planctomycetes bacterium]|nr:sigma-70 family RNA polymerase sigma factor [Planctomycetota bacterium]